MIEKKQVEPEIFKLFGIAKTTEESEFLKQAFEKIENRKKDSNVSQSSVSDIIRHGIDKEISTDKKLKFEDTELFKWFGKFKYTEGTRKIEDEIEKGKDGYQYN